MTGWPLVSWHSGLPLAPHDLWTAWSLDPLVLVGLALLPWLYVRGRLGSSRRVAAWREWCLVGAMAALVLALVSPLDALAGALASAHMAQHVLLTLVAAPLLVLAGPWAAVVRGTPAEARRAVARARVRLRLTRRTTRVLRNPAVVWLLYAGNLWFWHGSGPYVAALQHDVVHAVEHAAFLGTGLLFWTVTVDTLRREHTSPGLGLLMQFLAAMQGVFLSALLVFAETAWYPPYAETAGAWGLTAVADQQVAGLVLWLPGGLVHLAAGLTLLMVWVQRSEPVAAPGR